MRCGTVADVVISIAFGRLTRMGGGCQPIKRIVAVVVLSSTIDHLRDVVDCVELILEIGQRVGTAGVSQARQTIQAVILIGGCDSVWLGARGHLVCRVVGEGRAQAGGVSQLRETVQNIVLVSSTCCRIETQLRSIGVCVVGIADHLAENICHRTHAAAVVIDNGDGAIRVGCGR